MKSWQHSIVTVIVVGFDGIEIRFHWLVTGEFSVLDDLVYLVELWLIDCRRTLKVAEILSV